jgi:putative ABC transport system permease protein
VPADPDAPRKRWTILALAVDPTALEQTFRNPAGIFASDEEMARDAATLASIGTVFIDRTSRKEYGDPHTWKPGTVNEINGRQVVIAGQVTIGTGFAYNGLLLTGEATLTRVLGWPEDQVTFGLVQLAPGSDPARVKEDLQDYLGSDALVLTRQEINGKERQFWLTKTAVGQFFASGVLIALLVGGVFVYQMMKADIYSRQAEFATIRALGYPDGYLTSVVYWQGLLLSVGAYLPGLAAALLCYRLTRWSAGIPIGMSPAWLVLVPALTVGMCMLSAWMAVRDVYNADPADLFK